MREVTVNGIIYIEEEIAGKGTVLVPKPRKAWNRGTIVYNLSIGKGELFMVQTLPNRKACLVYLNNFCNRGMVRQWKEFETIHELQNHFGNEMIECENQELELKLV